MLLRYTMSEQGRREYTLNFLNADNKPTLNAHPARFSPDDKFSGERIQLKKRHGLLPVSI